MAGLKPRWPVLVALGLLLAIAGGCASFDCGLRIADCGLKDNEPASRSVADATDHSSNPQSAIHDPQLPVSGPLTLDGLQQLAQAHNPILQRDAAKLESAR